MDNLAPRGGPAQRPRPEVIDGMQVLQRLGAGVLGEVYLVRHSAEGGGEEQRALRLLQLPATTEIGLPIDADSDTFQRVRREVRAMGRMEHRNVLPVFQTGQWEGQLYYAMEYMPARTLISYVDGPAEEKGGLSSPARMERLHAAMIQIARGLGHLHRQRVVHAALRPANVLVSSLDEVKLADYGLVTLAMAQRLSDAAVASYASPELAAGQLPDSRSDLYAMGVMLFRLLTGRLPFTGVNAAQILQAHREQPPPRVEALNSTVEPALAEICRRMLRKDPADRFRSASELTEALRACAPPSLQEGNIGRETTAVTNAAQIFSHASDDEEQSGNQVFAPGFVGRGGELKRLAASMREAAAGRGCILLVSGEAGIGKSRLVREAMSRALGWGMRSIEGHAPASGGAPFEALRPLLHLGAQVADEDPETYVPVLPPNRRAVLASIDPVFSEGIIPNLQGSPDPSHARSRIFDALRSVVAVVADQQPTLLVIEDLQRADSLTVEFLAFLARSLAAGDRITRSFGAAQAPGARPPIMVLCTARTGPESAAALRILAEMAEDDSSRVNRIELSPFDAREAAEMARSMLALPDLPHALGESLVQEAGGNPFYLQAMLRIMGEGGVLTHRSNNWYWAESNEPVAVADPPGGAVANALREAVVGGSAGVSDEARRVLEIAAVMGDACSYRLLRGVCSKGPQDEGPLLDAIDELVRARLLAEADTVGTTGTITTDRLRFYHDRLREAVYDSIEAKQRKGIHLEVAQAVVSRGHGGRSERELLAYHFNAGGDSKSAVRHYLAAAEDALAVGSPDTALKQLDHCAEMLDDLAKMPKPMRGLQVQREKVAFQRLEVLELVGRNREGLELARALYEELKDGVDKSAVVRVLVRLGRFLVELGEMEGAERTLDEALRLGDQGARARDVIDGWLALGRSHLLRGNLRAAGEVLRRGEELARRANMKDELIKALGSSGFVQLFSGKPRDARRAFAEATSVSRELEDRTAEAQCLGRLGIVDAYMGDFEEGITNLKTALDQARSLGLGPFEARCHSALAQLYAEVGQDKDARRHWMRSMMMHMEYGNPDGEAVCLGDMALFHYERGEWDQARSCSTRALAMARRVGDDRYVAWCLPIAGALRVRRNDAEGGLKDIEEGLEMARERGIADVEVLALIFRARARRMLEDADAARTDLEEAIARARACGHEWFRRKAAAILDG